MIFEKVGIIGEPLKRATEQEARETTDRVDGCCNVWRNVLKVSSPALARRCHRKIRSTGMCVVFIPNGQSSVL